MFTTPTTNPGSETGPGMRRLDLNNDVVAEILAASRAMPSWKACEMEGTDWSGTAAENAEKYRPIFGIQEGPQDYSKNNQKEG
jgi:hypothetical protein